MAIQQQSQPTAQASTLDPALVREAWINDRVREFQADPAKRDEAIAVILYDSLMLHEQFSELTAKVREEGIGGVLKALMGAMRGGK